VGHKQCNYACLQCNEIVCCTRTTIRAKSVNRENQDLGLFELTYSYCIVPPVGRANEVGVRNYSHLRRRTNGTVGWVHTAPVAHSDHVTLPHLRSSVVDTCVVRSDPWRLRHSNGCRRVTRARWQTFMCSICLSAAIKQRRYPNKRSKPSVWCVAACDVSLAVFLPRQQWRLCRRQRRHFEYSPTVLRRRTGATPMAGDGIC